MLRLRGIRKTFGGVVALDSVNFDLQPREIHALCGENGAGKSTLIKILSGVHPAGSFLGAYELDEQPARFFTHADAAAAGIAVIYQELALCEGLSVAENIFLGDEPVTGPFRFFLNEKRMLAQAQELLASFDIELDPRTPVHKLGIGQKQLVEIAKALTRRSRILILDEPTAALSERETEKLLALLRELRARGTACIYISHKLDEVFAIADRITVLRDGGSVFTRSAASVTTATVIAAMCGRAVSELYPPRRPRLENSAPPLLLLQDLTVADSKAEFAERTPRLRGISLALKPGEIVGIGGLLGAGRTELLLHLYGAFGKRLSGQVCLAGQPFAPQSPAEALSAGVALLSEDRRRYGLCMDESVNFNLSLSVLSVLRDMNRRRSAQVPRERLVGQAGYIHESVEAKRNLHMAKQLQLRSAAALEHTLRVAARTLSGGNQQKVVLGKALLTEPQLLLLDEPTRGIDVGARQEIYELLVELCHKGMAVLMVSSELPELLGLCDRILMLHNGAQAGEFTARNSTISAEALLAAALGHKAPALAEVRS